MQNKDIL